MRPAERDSRWTKEVVVGRRFTASLLLAALIAPPSLWAVSDTGTVSDTDALRAKQHAAEDHQKADGLEERLKAGGRTVMTAQATPPQPAPAWTPLPPSPAAGLEESAPRVPADQVRIVVVGKPDNRFRAAVVAAAKGLVGKHRTGDDPLLSTIHQDQVTVVETASQLPDLLAQAGHSVVIAIPSSANPWPAVANQVFAGGLSTDLLVATYAGGPFLDRSRLFTAAQRQPRGRLQWSIEHGREGDPLAADSYLAARVRERLHARVAPPGFGTLAALDAEGAVTWILEKTPGRLYLYMPEQVGPPTSMRFIAVRDRLRSLVAMVAGSVGYVRLVTDRDSVEIHQWSPGGAAGLEEATILSVEDAVATVRELAGVQEPAFPVLKVVQVGDARYDPARDPEAVQRAAFAKVAVGGFVQLVPRDTTGETLTVAAPSSEAFEAFVQHRARRALEFPETDQMRRAIRAALAPARAEPVAVPAGLEERRFAPGDIKFLVFMGAQAARDERDQLVSVIRRNLADLGFRGFQGVPGVFPVDTMRSFQQRLESFPEALWIVMGHGVSAEEARGVGLGVAAARRGVVGDPASLRPREIEFIATAKAILEPRSLGVLQQLLNNRITAYVPNTFAASAEPGAPTFDGVMADVVARRLAAPPVTTTSTARPVGLEETAPAAPPLTVKAYAISGAEATDATMPVPLPLDTVQAFAVASIAGQHLWTVYTATADNKVVPYHSSREQPTHPPLSLNGPIRALATPPLDQEGRWRVFVATDHRVVSYYREGGLVRDFSLTIPADDAIRTLAVGRGHVFVGTEQGHLYLADRHGQGLRRGTSVASLVTLAADPEADIAYLGTGMGKLLAFAPGVEDMPRPFPLGDSVETPGLSALAATADRLYACTQDGRVTAFILDPSTVKRPLDRIPTAVIPDQIALPIPEGYAVRTLALSPLSSAHVRQFLVGLAPAAPPSPDEPTGLEERRFAPELKTVVARRLTERLASAPFEAIRRAGLEEVHNVSEALSRTQPQPITGIRVSDFLQSSALTVRAVKVPQDSTPPVHAYASDAYYLVTGGYGALQIHRGHEMLLAEIRPWNVVCVPKNTPHTLGSRQAKQPLQALLLFAADFPAAPAIQRGLKESIQLTDTARPEGMGIVHVPWLHWSTPVGVPGSAAQVERIHLMSEESGTEFTAPPGAETMLLMIQGSGMVQIGEGSSFDAQAEDGWLVPSGQHVEILSDQAELVRLTIPHASAGLEERATDQPALPLRQFAPHDVKILVVARTAGDRFLLTDMARHALAASGNPALQNIQVLRTANTVDDARRTVNLDQTGLWVLLIHEELNGEFGLELAEQLRPAAKTSRADMILATTYLEHQHADVWSQHAAGLQQDGVLVSVVHQWSTTRELQQVLAQRLWNRVIGARLIELPDVLQLLAAGLEEMSREEMAATLAQWAASRFDHPKTALILGPSAITEEVRQVLLNPEVPAALLQPVIVWTSDAGLALALQVRDVAVADTPAGVSRFLTEQPFTATENARLYMSPEEFAVLMASGWVDVTPTREAPEQAMLQHLLPEIYQSLLRRDPLSAEQQLEAERLARAITRYL